jgi:hypothetical protein
LRETQVRIGFALVVIGTFGLLFNEVVADFGRIATLLFAVMSFIGLVILGYVYLKSR